MYLYIVFLKDKISLKYSHIEEVFSETTDGAEASMNAFSLIVTAKANGLDSLKYFEYLLNNRPSKEMSYDMEQLAPWSDNAIAACSDLHHKMLSYLSASNGAFITYGYTLTLGAYDV